LDNVPLPSRRVRTFQRGWRETDVKRERHIDLLTGIDGLGIQAVGFHHLRHRKASVPGKDIERFFLLDGVGKPAVG
jgi:hypothetical protein